MEDVPPAGTDRLDHRAPPAPARRAGPIPATWPDDSQRCEDTPHEPAQTHLVSRHEGSASHCPAGTIRDGTDTHQMNTENMTTTYETDRRLTDGAAPAGGWASRARQSLRRFDRYTLEVMNPGHPYRLPTDRSA